MSEPALTVAISGSRGFIGRHLANRLALEDGIQARALGRSEFEDPDRLRSALLGVDAVVHLAALNRGPDAEIRATNVRLVEDLIEASDQLSTAPPAIYFASSTQRSRDTAYGRSKLRGEEMLRARAESGRGAALILEIPNVFGPGCRPHYNSVVATFAHLAAAGEEPRVEIDREVPLLYVWSLVDRIVELLRSGPRSDYAHVPIEAEGVRSVAELKSRFLEFASSFHRGEVPPLHDRLEARLYGTFLAFLSPGDYRRPLQVHSDERGRLAEIVRSGSGGQVFFSVTKPGVIRGQHFHSRKLEKFCVVDGSAVIRLQPLGGTDVLELHVTGDEPEAVDIPFFTAHHIENVGDGDLLTLFWSNELFDPEDPDTYPWTVGS